MSEISGRKRAEEALRESERRLRSLLEVSRDVIYRANLETGEFEYVSPAVEEVTGFTPEEHMAMGREEADERIHPDDLSAFREHTERLLSDRSAGDAIPRIDLRWRCKDGSYRWVSDSRTLIRGEDGRPEAIVGTVRDVTERKRVEATLRESEAEYSALLEQANDGVIVAQDGVFKFVNKAYAGISGYSVDELTGMDFMDTIPREDRAPVAERYEKRLKGAHPSSPYEAKLLCKGGTTKEVEFSAASIMYKGRPAVMGIVRDISERKRAEQELRESEEKYRALVQVSIDGIAVVEGLEMRFANEAMLRMFGCESEEDMVGRPFTEFVSPEHRDLMVERARARDRGQEVARRYEFKALRKDGTEFDAEISVGIITHQGREARQGIIRDISERKRAEATLRESEERFRKLFQEGPVGVAIVGLDFRFVNANAMLCEALGYTQDELSELTFPDITYPEDRDKDIRYARQLFEGEIPFYKIEKRYVRKDGKVIWATLTASVMRDEEGRPLYGLGMVEDISERKRAEEELRRREQELRVIADSVPALFSYLDADGYYRFVNKGYGEWFGIPQTEIIGKHYREVLGEDTYAVIRDRVERALSGERVSFEEAVPYRLGGSRWVVARYVPDVDDEGKVRGFYALVSDISERKRAEDELRESEERFRRLSEAALEGIAIHDKGRILEANEALATMFGYEVAEIIGMHAIDLTAPESRDLLSQHILSGYVEPFEATGLRKGASTFPVVVQGRPIPYRGRTVSVSAIRDITALKQAEEALERGREELEAKVEAQILRGTPYGLTFRELTVLHLVAVGKADKEIAHELGISPLTVHKHLANILTKMDAKSRTEASVRATREGLLG